MGVFIHCTDFIHLFQINAKIELSFSQWRWQVFVFKGNLHPDGPDKQGSRAACVMLAKTITTQKQNKTGKQEEERKQR